MIHVRESRGGRERDVAGHRTSLNTHTCMHNQIRTRVCVQARFYGLVPKLVQMNARTQILIGTTQDQKIVSFTKFHLPHFFFHLAVKLSRINAAPNPCEPPWGIQESFFPVCSVRFCKI